MMLLRTLSPSLIVMWKPSHICLIMLMLKVASRFALALVGGSVALLGGGGVDVAM